MIQMTWWEIILFIAVVIFAIADGVADQLASVGGARQAGADSS